MANICCVIPARLNSSRFDRKLVKKINGIPLLEFVRRKIMQSFLHTDIFITTGDKEIEKIINNYDGNIIKSKKKHKDGTSRVIEAIANLNYKNVLIVQGDEPLVSKKILNKFKKIIMNNPNIKCFNYVTKLKKEKDDLSISEKEHMMSDAQAWFATEGNWIGLDCIGKHKTKRPK